MSEQDVAEVEDVEQAPLVEGEAQPEPAAEAEPMPEAELAVPPEIPWEKRFHDTEASFTQAKMRAAELERQVEALQGRQAPQVAPEAVTLPDLTPDEINALIPAAQEVMRVRIAAGWSEDDARNHAWSEVVVQARATKHMMQAMIEPVRQASAESSYAPVSTQAAAKVRGVEAAEIDAALRTMIPAQQWAQLPPEVRAQSAAMLAKTLAYDRMTAAPAAPAAPASQSAPRVAVPAGTGVPMPMSPQLAQAMNFYKGMGMTDADARATAERVLKNPPPDEEWERNES